MEYLSTKFKDDILNTEVNEKRKYRMIYNSDGTVSFEDVTVYSQTGTAYGAKEVIEEREKINELLDILFPIGIVITLSTDDPVFQQKTPMDLGYPGQWEPFADGRCIMGYKKGDSDFAFGYEGGSKTVTLNINQIPSHNHSVSGGACTTGNNGNHNHTVTALSRADNLKFNVGSNVNGYLPVDPSKNLTSSTNGNHNHSVPNHSHNVTNAGGSQAHNNMPPYKVARFWERVS